VTPQLANQLGCDIWVHVPARANDDYILNMAKLLYNVVDPDLAIYVEYSNEASDSDFILI
jgi:hypothetical protein